MNLMNNGQMESGNENPTQHLPWWLWKTTKKPQSGWSAPGFEPGTSQMRVSCITTEPPRLWDPFRSFKVCLDAKERLRGGKQRKIPQSLLKLQPWFLGFQWKTCLQQKCNLGSCVCSERLAPGFEPGTSRMRVSCNTTEPPRLKKTNKSLKYESFNHPSVFIRVFLAAWQKGSLQLEEKTKWIASAWHFTADHSTPNWPVHGTKRVKGVKE